MMFTCAICEKNAEGQGTVDLGELGCFEEPPRGRWARTLPSGERQVTCSWEHAQRLMAPTAA